MSTVEFNFLGGAGDDTLNTLIGGSTGELLPAVMPSTITMRLDGGEGNDKIGNTFRNISLNGRVNLNADGGSGNDRVQETFDHARFNAGLDIEVLGGAGNDELILMGQSRVSVDSPFDPSFIAMSQVRIRFDGGAGNDHLLGDIVPCVLPAGTLDMIFAGGEGDDIFDFNFAFEDAAKSTTPYGAVRMSFQGGAGTDQLRLRMLNAQNSASPIMVRLDGIERLV